MSDDDEQARRAKIARLNRQIADGTYEVDADAVAERMLAKDALHNDPRDDETAEMTRAEGASEEADDGTHKNPVAGSRTAEAAGDDDTDDTELNEPGDER